MGCPSTVELLSRRNSELHSYLDVVWPNLWSLRHLESLIHKEDATMMHPGKD